MNAGRYNYTAGAEVLPTVLLTVLLMLTAAIAPGCTGRSGSGGKSTQLFTDTVYAPEYAGGFQILAPEAGESRLISVRNPWQGADSVARDILILRGDERAPAGFEGEILHGDAHRIVATSSTHVAMLDAVGAVDAVVGVSGIDFISNPTILKRAAEGLVADIGYEGNVNYETLLSLSPDLVLLYGVNGASPMEAKLKELGVPYMYVGDYLEESPLGKAEWLVAIAETLGQRERGVETFAPIPRDYNLLKRKVTDHLQSGGGKSLRRPVVMLNTPYNDAWYMPSTQNYTVRLISDAGGQYIYPDNSSNASEVIDIEEAYTLVSKADVWLTPGRAVSLAEVRQMCPKFTDLEVLREGRVYNNNRRLTPAGGNDYYESGIVRPDLILRDLVKIFYPQMVGEEFVYYRQLK